METIYLKTKSIKKKINKNQNLTKFEKTLSQLIDKKYKDIFVWLQRNTRTNNGWGDPLYILKDKNGTQIFTNILASSSGNEQKAILKIMANAKILDVGRHLCFIPEIMLDIEKQDIEKYNLYKYWYGKENTPQEIENDLLWLNW